MGSLWGAHFSENSVSLERIEIFQFCLKIQHLWWLPHPWVGVWVVGWVDGGASTDVESSNRIEISRLGQGIFNFE